MTRFTLLALGLIVSIGLHAQNYPFIKVEDVEVEVVGLNKEFEERFKDPESINVLCNDLNRHHIFYFLKPLKITVRFEDGVGVIELEMQYKSNLVYQERSEVQQHEVSLSNYMPDGFSMLLFNRVFDAVGQYRKAVATNNLERNSEIMKFYGKARLIKGSDFLNYFCEYYRDGYGYFRSRPASEVYAEIGGKQYSIETQNLKALDEFNYFVLPQMITDDSSPKMIMAFLKPE